MRESKSPEAGCQRFWGGGGMDRGRMGMFREAKLLFDTVTVDTYDAFVETHKIEQYRE